MTKPVNLLNLLTNVNPKDIKVRKQPCLPLPDGITGNDDLIAELRYWFDNSFAELPYNGKGIILTGDFCDAIADMLKMSPDSLPIFKIEISITEAKDDGTRGINFKFDIPDTS